MLNLVFFKFLFFFLIFILDEVLISLTFLNKNVYNLRPHFLSKSLEIRFAQRINNEYENSYEDKCLF